MSGDRLSLEGEAAIRRAASQYGGASPSIRVLLAEIDALRAELDDAKRWIECASQEFGAMPPAWVIAHAWRRRLERGTKEAQ